MDNKLPFGVKLAIEGGIWAALNLVAILRDGHLNAPLLVGALLRAAAHLLHPIIERTLEARTFKSKKPAPPSRLREGLRIAAVAVVAGVLFDAAYHLTA